MHSSFALEISELPTSFYVSVSGTGYSVNDYTSNFTDKDGTSNIGGAYKVEVTAHNATDCSIDATASVNIYVGCGALTAANTWSKFMCHNLGADQTKDPFTPSRDINGSYFTWGAKTAVLTQNVGDDVAPYSSGDWKTTLSGRYGSGDTYLADDKVKNATYDPCPAGYRVPNYNEWNYLGQNNTRTNNSVSYPPSATSFTGSNFGKALFLPAAGWRDSSDEGGNSISMADDTRTFGYSVRCIAE